jgi:hypothetical protein
LPISSLVSDASRRALSSDPVSSATRFCLFGSVAWRASARIFIANIRWYPARIAMKKLRPVLDSLDFIEKSAEMNGGMGGP